MNTVTTPAHFLHFTPYNQDDAEAFYNIAMTLDPTNTFSGIILSEHYRDFSSRFCNGGEFLASMSFDERFMYCMFMYHARNEMKGFNINLY